MMLRANHHKCFNLASKKRARALHFSFSIVPMASEQDIKALMVESFLKNVHCFRIKLVHQCRYQNPHSKGSADTKPACGSKRYIAQLRNRLLNPS